MAMALAQARKARGGAPGDARLRRGGLGTVAQGAGGQLAGGWRAPGRQPSDRGGRKRGRRRSWPWLRRLASAAVLGLGQSGRRRSVVLCPSATGRDGAPVAMASAPALWWRRARRLALVSGAAQAPTTGCALRGSEPDSATAAAVPARGREEKGLRVRAL
ncbi:unnamed protein product [Miscanthus lutarioriparius]|uniref:Uncharacterized protein n=1 Tax=Miscanthus lutarioriparius TaxID=422564 RepID=A0A811RH17_9POAL|nr:unnamed protein product [Miscanthus lutarioriparius]